jgi:hypothetical protein
MDTKLGISAIGEAVPFKTLYAAVEAMLKNIRGWEKGGMSREFRDVR